MNCKNCYNPSLFPNFAIVYLIDEDSSSRNFEEDYFLDTGNDALFEYASYLRELYESGSISGFLGIILVAVDNGSTLVSRFNQFKEYCGEDLSQKIVVLADPLVNRNANYSQELIQAIESLRQIPEQEELLDLNYIITNIDSSGSHNLDDFNLSFLDYYQAYSVEECFNRTQEIFSEYNNDLDRSFSYLEAEFLVNGVGTNHIIKSAGEFWYLIILSQIYKFSADLKNNWVKNCNIICNQRWTTTGQRYALPLYGFFPSDGFGLSPDERGIEGIQYSDIQNINDIYSLVHSQRVRSVNFPKYGNPDNPNTDDRAPLEAIDYYILDSRYPNHPLSGNNLLYNTVFERGGNCPCWIFDPVKNYLEVISE